MAVPALLGAILGFALAADPCPVRAESAVAVDTTGGGLVLAPQLAHAGGSLVVAGARGRVLERRFGADETIVVTPVTADGEPLADGRYRWELRLAKTLPTEVAEALAVAAEEGDVEVYRALVRSVGGTVVRAAGRFEVRGGAVVVEAHSVSTAASGAVPAGASASPLPQAPSPLSIEGASPQLIFDETDAPDGDFTIEANGGTLATYSGSPGGMRVMGVGTGASADSIFIAPGSVGLFTSTPAGPDVELHIVADADTLPELRLDDGGGQSWDLRVLGDDFQIQDETARFPPTGGVLEIDKSGTVVAPTYELVFRGGATIEGDVAMGSSRETKTDLEPAAVSELLAGLAELELYRWRYADDPSGARHLGPMAEDLFARFGLGRDDKHISPGDSAALALAAAQALYDLVREKDAEIEALAARVAELEAHLMALSARISTAGNEEQ